MRRAAEERDLAKRRARERAATVGGEPAPGRYRKSRPHGCRRAGCGLCQRREPRRRELRERIEEAEAAFYDREMAEAEACAAGLPCSLCDPKDEGPRPLSGTRPPPR